LIRAFWGISQVFFDTTFIVSLLLLFFGGWIVNSQWSFMIRAFSGIAQVFFNTTFTVSGLLLFFGGWIANSQWGFIG